MDEDICPVKDEISFILIVDFFTEAAISQAALSFLSEDEESSRDDAERVTMLLEISVIIVCSFEMKELKSPDIAPLYRSMQFQFFTKSGYSRFAHSGHMP